MFYNIVARIFTNVFPSLKTFEHGKKVAKQGDNVAKVAHKELEKKTGKKVVTALNAILRTG